ncbi:DnaB-like helicase C-terminal domain-containing protein [Kitasatospora sp. NPDC056800]|uniref:DnaB-like helicase C-terminal domain-containing protein n=1 Tax=Kitasatospora sp. NPDC056800 TaxID=3345948 RepID=UPI0036C1DDEF
MGGKAGEPLPAAFRQLEKAGCHIRRGQLTLIAAGPGVGKSALVTTIATRAEVPTLYFSADSDAFTQYVRLAAMLTDTPVWAVERDMDAGKSVHYDTQINNLDYLRWNFDASPTLDNLDLDVQAFGYLYGCWPQLIIVDNIKNVWTDAGDDNSKYGEIIDYLHELGRKTGAAVVALHHLTGTYDDGITPAPMSALLGKISKIPEVILTLHRSGSLDFGDLMINVSIVKNRGGKADPSGNWFIPLQADMERMRID